MTKNPIDPDAKNARPAVKQLHFNKRHAAAPQIKRILTDAGGVGATVLEAAVSVVVERDVCADFEKAPRLPAAGTPLVSAFDEKAQAALLFTDNLVTPHNMDSVPRRTR